MVLLSHLPMASSISILRPPPSIPLPKRRISAARPITAVAIQCSSKSTDENVPRRFILASSIVLGLGLASCPHSAIAVSFLDKYVKRKKLEPLESYVPAVILTQAQFKDLERLFDIETPDFESSRSFLRSGPAASLRVNIRAVAQYAADDGKGKAASDAVEQCLRALEDLDSLLLHASRKDPNATVEVMRGKIIAAVEALDSLLQTVPGEVLDKGKAIADAYLTPNDTDEQNDMKLDNNLKELEEIL